MKRKAKELQDKALDLFNDKKITSQKLNELISKSNHTLNKAIINLECLEKLEISISQTKIQTNEMLTRFYNT